MWVNPDAIVGITDKNLATKLKCEVIFAGDIRFAFAQDQNEVAEEINKQLKEKE